MLKNGKIRVETVKIGEQKKQKNFTKKTETYFFKKNLRLRITRDG